MLALQPWVRSRPEAERFGAALRAARGLRGLRRGAPGSGERGAARLGAHAGGAAPARVRPLGARPRRLDRGRRHRRREGDDPREPGGRLRRGRPLPPDRRRRPSPAPSPARRWCASTPTASPRCSSPPPVSSSRAGAPRRSPPRRSVPGRRPSASGRALPARRSSFTVSALRLSVRRPVTLAGARAAALGGDRAGPRHGPSRARLRHPGARAPARRPRPYSSRMNLRGFSGMPFTRTS